MVSQIIPVEDNFDFRHRTGETCQASAKRLGRPGRSTFCNRDNFPLRTWIFGGEMPTLILQNIINLSWMRIIDKSLISSMPVGDIGEKASKIFKTGFSWKCDQQPNSVVVGLKCRCRLLLAWLYAKGMAPGDQNHMHLKDNAPEPRRPCGPQQQLSIHTIYSRG
jgi:hypothetical protein